MENSITLSAEEYRNLIYDAIDGLRLKAFLEKKRNHYYGITREEVETLCKMFDIDVDVEEA